MLTMENSLGAVGISRGRNVKPNDEDLLYFPVPNVTKGGMFN